MNRKSPKQDGMSRRTILAAGAATAGVIAGFPYVTRAQARTIVSTLFGGVYEERYRATVLQPFERKTGVKFEFKYGAPDEWLNSAIINKDNPEIDLPFLSLPVAMRALTIPDLFLDLTPEMIPNLRDVHPAFYDGYNKKAVGFNYIDSGFLYRKDRVSNPPRSWRDLWDPRFKGQIVLPDVSGGTFYELVMIATLQNGGSETNITPGIEALKRLKPNIVRWYKSVNEVSGIIERGEALIAAGFAATRAYAMVDAGAPVDYIVPSDGAPIGVLSYHVPIKAKNRNLLLEFINFALEVEQQKNFGNAMQSGMVNTKTALEDKVKARTAPHDKLLRLNWQAIQPKFGEIAERVTKEVISG
ncbi:MAG: extracellular solute-binding protein [Alphaproteobacteria bacterium]|nr:extracellular solute-binding protein [Alphaproteobacteria bacterium]